MQFLACAQFKNTVNAPKIMIFQEIVPFLRILDRKFEKKI